MAVIDMMIVAGFVVSMVVGVVRGFMKEAISLAALLTAIWAALYFGPGVGTISDSWISSAEIQMWFGRILVFAVVLSIGGLLGWGLSKLVRLSVLSGLDRLAGSLFGAARGVLLAAVFVIGGQFAGFSNDNWWLQSKLIPHIEVVSEWIKVMAPQGLELLTPAPADEPLDISLPAAIGGNT